MNQTIPGWFKLDNAGKLFPSIATDRFTTVFRMSADLKQAVDTELLQLALNHLIERLPYYQVHLKRGFFWYYFERTKELPLVIEERQYPCMYLRFAKKGNFPFQVLYYKNKISIEITHCLTDGTGAMVFLKSLLTEYLRLKGVKFQLDDWPGILLPEKPVLKEEYEYSFKKYYQPLPMVKTSFDYAMHFPFPLTEKGMHHIVTGIMPVSKVLKKAKQWAVSVTAFFLSLYFETIFEFIGHAPSYLRNELLKPVAMNIPVNLRPIFPSQTMFNFFLTINPRLDPRQEIFTFEKILEKISAQMQEAVKKENLLPYISRNVQGESSIFIRILPLILKDGIVPLLYQLLAENFYTSSISNMGKISLPAQLENYIQRFEYIPSPSKGNMIKTSVLTYQDKLYFTFGKLTRVTIIERIFFRKLIKMGIPVKIETNG